MTPKTSPGRKILIIDDEPHIVAYLESLLQDNGYQTISASDGKSGFEIAGKERPDLVVLDLMMPKRTGNELYKHFARDKVLREIPVIVVSAIPRSHLAMENPFAFFDKPIDPQRFLNTVKLALNPASVSKST